MPYPSRYVPEDREPDTGCGLAVERHPGKLWSLWDMLHSYSPIYQLTLELQDLRTTFGILKTATPSSKLSDVEVQRFRDLLSAAVRVCRDHGFDYASDMAQRAMQRDRPQTYADMFAELNHVNDSLVYELDREAVFRVHRDRKGSYGKDDLFGPEVAHAFPSCAHDIREAGNCYALEQGDACVHHLMLVLERGLNALATKLEVPYERTNWQNIIEGNASKLKLRGAEFDFHREANSQFGFLKDTYRNHSEHARDDHCDVPKALSILDHVRSFMQALAKGGLSE